jgi:uncharacterized membrane protein (UPF0182 family)
MPELRRVIVVYGERVVMDQNLEGALKKIFGPGAPPAVRPSTPGTGASGDSQIPGTLSISDLADKAALTFEEAKLRQQEGDWAGYGERMAELEAILLELQRVAGQPGETAADSAAPSSTDNAAASTTPVSGDNTEPENEL